MADELKPLPVKDAALEQIDNLGSDFASSDFDGALKASTAAARSKSLSDFPGDKPPADASLLSDSGNVDDAALQAAVAAEPVAASATDTPAAAASTDVAKPEAKPAAAAADAKPAAQPAAKPEPKVYDPAEKFALADGIELTREQMAQTLRERQAWGQAANEFQEVFRCTPQQAKQFWKPYVDRLIAEPQLGQYIDSAIETYSNPEKRAYIEKCAAFFDAEKPAAALPAKPQVAQIPPEVQQELAASRAFRQQMEQRAALDQVESEKRTLVAQHPQLADASLMQLVAQRTFAVLAEQQRTGQPQTYTLTQAARDMRGVIEKWGVPAQAAAPAPKVPALNTGSGAAPSVRAQVDMKPRKFKSPDEALADWDTNVAASLGFK